LTGPAKLESDLVGWSVNMQICYSVPQLPKFLTSKHAYAISFLQGNKELLRKDT